ncbi:hypothetical protein BH11BAC2_BH11BAC2_12890 [soil metagenome]
MKYFTSLLFLICFGSSNVFSQTTPYVTTVPYLSGFLKPVKLTHCKDNRLFVVEQDGKIKIVDSAGTTLAVPFLDINARVNSSGNEQGLLGLAFHPNFKQNGFFYVDYTNNTGVGNTVIARYSVDPADSNLALVNSEVILLTITQPYSNHNGGDVNFGADGYLYIGMGDGGSGGDPQNNAQNTGQRLGKMLRIDVDHGTSYAIPADNPFINSTTAAKEVWNVGMRNPWRYTFDRITGDMWIGDVGQSAFEEVDFQAAGTGNGLNYGWRCYEGNSAYNTSGCQPQNTYEAPVYTFSHAGYCSITGGCIYRGAKYANLFGYYLFSDYCNPTIQSLKKNGNVYQHDNHSTWSGAGISSFGEDFEGELYVTNLSNGQIRKIADTTSCSPVAFLADVDTLNICDSAFVLRTPQGSDNLYLWTLNDTSIVGTNSNELAINQSGSYLVTVLSTSTFCSATDTVYINLLGAVAQTSFTNLDTFYCVYNSPVTLNASPAGGVFSGTGVTTGIFDPAAAGIGTHILTYDYTNTNGCVSTSKEVITVNACTGMNENKDFSVYTIYPNPVNEILTAQINNIYTGTATAQIVDLSGRILRTVELTLNGEPFSLSMNCFEISSGGYLLKLQTGNAMVIQPFMIVK